MVERPIGTDATTVQTAPIQDGVGPWVLLVIHDGIAESHPIPDHGTVRIGRSSGADIRIDHPAMSRLHFSLQMGSEIWLTDLGSTNGVTVGKQRLSASPQQIRSGEMIEIQDVLMMLQRTTTAERPRRVGSHAYFEARVDEECRASTSGSLFGVLRVSWSGDESRALGALSAELRAEDVIAKYAPSNYEMLIASTTEADLELRCASIEAALHRDGRSCVVGHAVYPRDGRTSEALLAHVARALRGESADVAQVVVRDGGMRQLWEFVERVAASDLPILLMGETGVGKDVFARAIHNASPRAKKPFLSLNCAALTEGLFESELFGFERGAFTGAVREKPGLFETAEAGTVFLDEIGELPLELQAKLLRVLEDREVRRVGGTKSRRIDVRFVSATNRNLAASIASGGFRQDLFYRVNGVTVVIPPLRDRTQEIEPLALAFIRGRSTADRLAFSPAALERLHAYRWPGNIRELRNVIERAVVLAGDRTIEVADLGIEETPTFLPPPVAPASLESAVSSASNADGERDRILRALADAGGNQTIAARTLGISRRTLLHRLDRHQVQRPRKRTT